MIWPGDGGYLAMGAVAFGAIFALVYVFTGIERQISWQRSAVKSGSVAALALAVWFGTGLPWLIAALLLSAFGDLCLSRGGRPVFLIGVLAFAAAHVAYSVLFLTHWTAQPERILQGARLQAIGLLGISALVMAGVLWRFAGALRGAVIAYVPFILAMGISVLALPLLGPMDTAYVGALLFITSDILLAFRLFVTARAPRLLSGLIWCSYWPAQAIFAISLGISEIK